VDNAAGTIE